MSSTHTSHMPEARAVADDMRARGLMTWMGYARAGTELAICEALEVYMESVTVPRDFDLKSRGKDRTAKIIDRAYLPNQIFMTGTAGQYQRVQSALGSDTSLKGLARLFQVVPLMRVYDLHQWAGAIEETRQERLSGLKRGEMLSQYTPGEAVHIAKGPFSEWLETQTPIFVGMVKAAHDPFPRMRVSVPMMGRQVEVDVDPLHVRKVV